MSLLSHNASLLKNIGICYFIQSCLNRISFFQVHMKEVMSAVWVQGLDQSYLQEQMLGDSLMREVIRNYCMESLGGAAQHGEALLAAFKPRGYSECIVTVGGEERT